jgi:hypothetical protein
MATAYKYVERQVDDQINWAEVTSNLTNTLKEEGRVRQEKKTAIDDASREYAKILNNVPVGENTELNKFALNAASDLQQQMLMQTTLLKSGQLDPRQYTIMRQNLTDGTDQAFSLFQNYNAEYDKKMAMMDPNLPPNERASAMQTWQMSELEGFGNFKNSKLVINPNSGLMSMAKMVPDPNFTGDPANAPMVPDMNNLQSVQALENRLKGTVTQYDVMGAADTYLDSLGEDKRAVITGLGQKYTSAVIKTISDATAKQKGSWKNMNLADLTAEAKRLGVDVDDLKEITLFSEAQDNWVKGQLGVGGTAAASVLLDYKSINPITSEPYTQLQWSEANEAKAKLDSNIILMKNVDGRMVPDLTEDQQAEAERVMKTQINIGLDYEETLTTQKTGFEKSATNEKADNAKKDNKAVVGNIAKLWYGDDAEVKTAEDYLKSTNPEIAAITRTGEGIVIEYTATSGLPVQEIPFEQNGQTVSQEQFVEGNANYFFSSGNKIKNIPDLLSKNKLDLSRTFNDRSKAFTFNESETKESESDAFDRITLEEVTTAGFTPDLFVADDEDQTLTNVSGFITGLPGMEKYTVVDAGGSDDEIHVLDEDDNIVEIFELDAADKYIQADDAPKYIKRLLQRSRNLQAAVDKKGDFLYNKTQGKRNIEKKKPSTRFIQGAKMGDEIFGN